MSNQICMKSIAPIDVLGTFKPIWRKGLTGTSRNSGSFLLGLCFQACQARMKM